MSLQGSHIMDARQAARTLEVIRTLMERTCQYQLLTARAGLAARFLLVRRRRGTIPSVKAKHCQNRKTGILSPSSEVRHVHSR
jgi:hypothetical protein